MEREVCYVTKEGAVQIRLGGDNANVDLGKVGHRHSGLATAGYFHRTIAIFVVHMGFAVDGSQSIPHLSRHTACPATQGGTLHALTFPRASPI